MKRTRKDSKAGSYTARDAGRALDRRLRERPLGEGERCCGACGATLSRLAGGGWQGCEHVEEPPDPLDLRWAGGAFRVS